MVSGDGDGQRSPATDPPRTASTMMGPAVGLGLLVVAVVVAGVVWLAFFRAPDSADEGFIEDALAAIADEEPDRDPFRVQLDAYSLSVTYYDAEMSEFERYQYDTDGNLGSMTGKPEQGFESPGSFALADLDPAALSELGEEAHDTSCDLAKEYKNPPRGRERDTRCDDLVFNVIVEPDGDVVRARGISYGGGAEEEVEAELAGVAGHRD